MQHDPDHPIAEGHGLPALPSGNGSPICANGIAAQLNETMADPKPLDPAKVLSQKAKVSASVNDYLARLLPEFQNDRDRRLAGAALLTGMSKLAKGLKADIVLEAIVQELAERGWGENPLDETVSL